MKLVIATVLALSLSPVQGLAFTMSDVLSAPFVSNLTTSSDGTALVWEVHLRGTRNLYALLTPGAPIRKLTNYNDDDGQDFQNVAFTPAKDAVVYMRGGTEDNSGGDNINPNSSILVPTRSIYLINTNGGTPLKIGDGTDVTLAPTGSEIAWINNGALQIATLSHDASGYHAGKPEALPIHGKAAEPQWSPDGTTIAFTNLRNDHSFIVIYRLGGTQLTYATPDFSTDRFPHFSPDGTRVAFIRMPGQRENEDPYIAPSRDPFSIWVADARTGSTHLAFRARRGMGAQFYELDSPSQLFWAAGDRIVFPWEGDGWRHLYAVPAAGGPAALLTPGRFEVETATVSLDGNSMLYATNENDIDHRHIWQVALDGAKPHALTSGSQNQWAPTALAAGGYAYVNAGYNAVPTVEIGGTPPQSLIAEATPANFPAADLVEPQLITFRAPDGLRIHAQLFLPRDGRAKHPAIIFDHGGSQRQMLPGFHYMEAYTNLYESNQYFANHGFVVLSINYRSGIMYGHAFREAKNFGWRGASEYQDVLAGARFLQGRSDVDRNRLGIYGLSYGGYLTALGLARNSDIFKAGVDYAGVHNWATTFDGDFGHRVGDDAARKVAYDASPIASLDRWRSPVFLSQGDDDRNVWFSQGVDLATRLRDRGIEVQTLVFPNETHENQVWAHMVQLYDAAAAFMRSKLGGS